MSSKSAKHADYQRRFYHHILRALLLVAGLTAVSLSAGILGYHFIAQLGWIDSLLNASMILSGMGPVGELKSDAPKIFASFYALFSGIVLIAAAGLILSPMFHRVLYVFHIEDKETG